MYTAIGRKKLSKILVGLIILISILNFLGTKFYWYYTIWYFDMPMHFLGGLWIGLLFVYLFSLKDDSLGSVLKVLLCVLVVGVGWEIFEIFVNDVIAKNPFNFLDTVSDIFFDLSGGLCAIIYLTVLLENQRTGNEE